MKQYEAVIEVMKANHGYAPLGVLYSEVLKIPDVKWGTKTPYASIRRIVQVNDAFFKIKPGLWGLKEYRDRIPKSLFADAQVETLEPESQSVHTLYQGLLTEIGNLQKYETFVPIQDKNRLFNNKPLGSISTIQKFYQFGYEYLVSRAITIDVTWFNERKMPERAFEVENSTDIQNSLLKYVELQDFNIRFYIVADSVRVNEYEQKLKYSAFDAIRSRVKFLSYEKIIQWHAKTVEFSGIDQEMY